MTTASINPERLISRREAVALVRQEYGLPIALSSFQAGPHKLCPNYTEPCARAAPKPATVFGKRKLYSQGAIHAWALRLRGAVS